MYKFIRTINDYYASSVRIGSPSRGETPMAWPLPSPNVFCVPPDILKIPTLEFSIEVGRNMRLLHASNVEPQVRISSILFLHISSFRSASMQCPGKELISTGSNERKERERGIHIWKWAYRYGAGCLYQNS